MKGVDVELVDPAAPSSQIWVRSAAVSDGYFPERDEEKLDGGIFVSDDLLKCDGAGFRIVGRISDVMRSSITGCKRERPPAILPQWIKPLASAEADFYHGRDPNE